MTNAPWQLLPWDSNYFGLRIARIDQPLSAAELKRYFDWHREQAVQCTYYLCPIDQLDVIHAATGLGFQFMDVRITLECCISGKEATANRIASMRLATGQDLDSLETLASELHQDTRFFADKRFPVDQVKNLYALWMRRDWQDPSGAVHVWANDKNQPVGYLSCQVKEGQGNIGLFGVANGYQGRGIGKGLLQCGLDWFHRKECQSVQVVTQGKNTAALASYVSQGFRIASMSLWLHHWADSGSS